MSLVDRRPFPARVSARKETGTATGPRHPFDDGISLGGDAFVMDADGRSHDADAFVVDDDGQCR